MKKVLIVLACMLLAWPQTAISKNREPEPDVRNMPLRERFFMGGFLGIQLGDITSISGNAYGGFRFTNRLSAGTGGYYQFANERWMGRSYTSHIYGFSIFSRLRLIDRFFIHAEHEWLSVVSRDNHTQQPGSGPRVQEKNLLLGPGYSFTGGGKVSLNLMLLYNFNENSRIYYQNPFFRVGVEVGL